MILGLFLKEGCQHGREGDGMATAPFPIHAEQELAPGGLSCSCEELKVLVRWWKGRPVLVSMLQLRGGEENGGY